jgi:hypothetical protein
LLDDIPNNNIDRNSDDLSLDIRPPDVLPLHSDSFPEVENLESILEEESKRGAGQEPVKIVL